MIGIYKCRADNNDLVDNIDDVEFSNLSFFINYVNRLAKSKALVSHLSSARKKIHMPSIEFLESARQEMDKKSATSDLQEHKETAN